MPIITKEKHTAIYRDLNNRIAQLQYVMEPRLLIDPREGIKTRGGFYADPDQMRATRGTDYDIRLAVEDFKTILAELKRLK